MVLFKLILKISKNKIFSIFYISKIRILFGKENNIEGNKGSNNNNNVTI